MLTVAVPVAVLIRAELFGHDQILLLIFILYGTLFKVNMHGERVARVAQLAVTFVIVDVSG